MAEGDFNNNLFYYSSTRNIFNSKQTLYRQCYENRFVIMFNSSLVNHLDLYGYETLF